MARDHGRMNLDIWGDDDFLDVSPPGQHLYFVLWFSPGLSYCGAGDWHPGRLASKSRGWTADSIRRAAAELSNADGQFLLVDEDTEEFLLRSWIKHDGLWKQPNLAVSLAKARAELASRTLRGVVVHEVAKIQRREPECASWRRDAVLHMLQQKPIDPVMLPRYGATDPASDPPVDPYSHPALYPVADLNRGVGADPGPTPSPTPTPFTPAPKNRDHKRSRSDDGEQRVTDAAYERTGKAFKFVAVRSMTKWLLERGEDQQAVEDAIVGVHELGKPITKQTLDQWLKGTLHGAPVKVHRDDSSGLLVER